MQYPKPLSAKTLEKKYAEAGFTQEEREFLHAFFRAAVNLYGVITIRDLWEIYRQLSDEKPRLHSRRLAAFSAIARREELPYCVFEISELYSAETNHEMDRFLVSKELILQGYYKMNDFYRFAEVQAECQHPFYIPDSFLSWADPEIPAEETKLRHYLENLVSTAEFCRAGNLPIAPRRNMNRGKKLSGYSFANHYEEMRIRYGSYASERNAVKEQCSVSEAEKIMRRIIRLELLGILSVNEIIRDIIEELSETGVEMDLDELNRFARLFMQYHNNTHHWYLNGWAPSELSRRMKYSGPPKVKFGPGIQKMMQNGDIDRDELIRMFREHGIEPSDDFLPS